MTVCSEIAPVSIAVVQGSILGPLLLITYMKVANLSALSPAFSSCIIYTHFVEIQRYLEIPPIDFCATSRYRRQSGPKCT